MSIVSTLGQLSGAPPPPASEGARCESRGRVLSFPGKHTRFAMAGPHRPRLWAFTLAVSPSGRFSHSLQVPAQMSVYHVKPQTAGLVHYASLCTPRPKPLVVPLFCFILPCIYHHAYRCLAQCACTQTHTHVNIFFATVLMHDSRATVAKSWGQACQAVAPRVRGAEPGLRGREANGPGL